MPRLHMANIQKRYGSTIALEGVSLQVEPGEVHALVGENGAGKSTLMKILSGAERPDRGTMTLDGAPYAPAGPQAARLRGVAMVYQELALAPHLDVETNVMLGLESSQFGFVQKRAQKKRVDEALALLDHPEIRSDILVARLSPGACQLVEVARALVVDARVLVFDEPTSSLSRRDTEHLFQLIRRLKDQGVSTIYISHFLEEVQRVADRYTILRDGQSVDTGIVSDVSLEAIIERMIGRRLGELYPRVAHAIGPPILNVRALSGQRMPVAVNLELRRGQVLGIFGLIGAGRTEFLRALFGLSSITEGVIELQGNTRTRASPGQRIAQGFGLLSEDRKAEGLALSQTIADNLTYSRLRFYSRLGCLRLGLRRQAVIAWLKRLRVRCRGPEQSVAELSGGNQQKIALGRLLHQEADILLLDEPTRGVDVGSKTEIYELIGKLAQAGKAVVFVSSYLPELLGICDHVAVMARGRLGPARAVGACSAEQIMAAATGGGES